MGVTDDRLIYDHEFKTVKEKAALSRTPLILRWFLLNRKTYKIFINPYPYGADPVVLLPVLQARLLTGVLPRELAALPRMKRPSSPVH